MTGAQVKPEARAEAAQAALKMSRASEAEAGCKSYRFYADLEDPNTFLIFEQWEDEGALLAHFQTPHMAEFNGLIPRFLAAPPSTITIASFEAIQFKIADMSARIDAAELCVLRASWLKDKARPHAREAATAKLLASEASWQAANAAIDALGGNGFAADYDVERIARETRLYTVAPPPVLAEPRRIEGWVCLFALIALIFFASQVPGEETEIFAEACRSSEEIGRFWGSLAAVSMFVMRRRFFVRLLAERAAIRREILALGEDARRESKE
ncbi:hypothetical protein B4Q13_15050 [Lacticaseibacillus rhamnosus]